MKLLRVKQYTKNLFLFLPLFFALKIFEVDLLVRAGIAFIGFCLIASSVYIINDYRDRIDDAAHPKKKFRPIASGKVSPRAALIIMVFLLSTGFTIQWYVGIEVLILSVSYFLLNLAYSFKLKQIAIVDVFVIALGFVIRIFVGGYATDITLQPWIVVMTFLLALFLALGKRRDDIIVDEEIGQHIRKAMSGYSIQLLDYAMVTMSSVILMAYLMYTLSADIENKFKTTNLYYTVFFVLMGIMRYMQLAFVYKKTGSPSDILLKDKVIQASIIGWIILFGILIYVR
jgi:4-hydroxybenzoate polyprenyltransferase